MTIEASASLNSNREICIPTSDRRSPPNAAVFNSFQQANEPSFVHPDWAIYNSAVYRTKEADYIVSRAVDRSAVCQGVPDRNVLVVVKSHRDGSFERLPDFNLPIGEAEGEVMNWEDPRIDGDIMGLTAVCKEGSSYIAYPALVKISVNGHGIEAQSKPVILRQVQGKNVIPFEGKFIFRRDEEPHVLQIMQPGLDGELKAVGEVDFRRFSNIYWGREKFGAVTRKIATANGFSILPIHGVREGVQGIDYPANFEELGQPRVKNVYSVGIAVVDQKWRVLAVDPEPLLTRSRYRHILPEEGELNCEKSVVYCCDFVETGDEIIFLVNVGDRITVFERMPRKSLEARALKILSSAI